MIRPTLYYLAVSPWSLKARCALRLRGVAVEERAYVPLIGEPALRLRMGRFSGKVTVPVLFTADGVLSDSFTIAQYAEAHGAGPVLFPEQHARAIAQHDQTSERLLSALRVCSMLQVAEDPSAALETLPSTTGKIIGGRGARAAVAAFNAKYRIQAGAAPQATLAARAELEAIRATLSGRAYVFEALSYADITLALALQLVLPLPDSPMGQASKQAATHAQLAAEFTDLLGWRDALHAKHGLLPTRGAS